MPCHKKTCFNFTLKYKEEGRGGGNGVKNQQNREGNRDCVRYFQHAYNSFNFYFNLENILETRKIILFQNLKIKF